MDKTQLFAIYFAGIVGWRMHPGYSRDNANPPLSVEECAKLASRMVQITEDYSCRGYSLREQSDHLF